MERRDFEFVLDLVNSFFGQKHIQKRFQVIEDKPITGWEIWFQVEFSVFLEDQLEHSLAFWDREFQYSIDRRRARHREYMAIDFVFRKKRAALEQYIALEVKQNTSVKSCIRGMMEDTCKVALVKSSHDDLRSMWTLGIHPVIETSELNEVIDEYADYFEVTLNKNCIESQPIKGTDFSYTLF
ncbi:hypothetical protein AB4516_22355 [Vibrio sp. 10N.222.54.F12]|uniref:hypothetical protein n=1 Tax=Vibrio TaxID=662 RepID=UPI000C85FD23|nr:hypothetical protein [Vibrio tasmaniensis]PML13622.1 hypothetical protein BCT83_18750 [Vibrio tasmaniensis]PML51471.1 hypothetical protein BCT76_22640 [Vibrio tasmaniensis]